ncbi:MAG: ABC transporter substrate-binding protein, partial [Aeromonas sp.]
MSRNRFVRWPLALATLLSLTSLAQPALAATRTISDNQGEKQIPTEAQRLVVFNPTILDTLDALGVSVAAVPKVETALPEFLKKYQTSSALNAGSMFEPDFEALSQYQPDLIIAGGRTTNAGTELAKLAPTLNFDRDDRHFPDSLRQQTLKLGEVFGK